MLSDATERSLNKNIIVFKMEVHKKTINTQWHNTIYKSYLYF